MAASKGKVKVSGVREMQTALRKFEATAADMKAVHRTVAEGLVPGIGLRSPRRSGALASSWAAGATKGRARLTSTAVYAGPIEFGWTRRGIEPAWMVRETVAASHDQILETYSREMERLAERIGFEANQT